MTASVRAATPRPRRGLLDTALALALGYAVYASTPLGAIAETGVRIARGQREHPSWFATFRGRETAVVAPTTTTMGEAWLAGRLPPSVERAAVDHSVDVHVLAALVAARGRCDERGACAIEAPDRLATFAPGKAGVVAIEDVAAGLAAARAALGIAPSSGRTEATGREDALALEALFVGAPPLQIAVAQARASGLAAPDDVEAHAPFLSPPLRRGPLQGALAVLLLHRLRTLAWPGEGFPVTSGFGDRISPISGERRFHNGTDIGMPTGTLVRSAHDGTVRRTNRDSVSGNYVIVDHGLGVSTAYCHLDEITAVERARVARRQPLGRSGTTGRSTGPHLHYVLRVQGRAVDPEAHGDRATTTIRTTLRTTLPTNVPTTATPLAPPPAPPTRGAPATPGEQGASANLGP